MLNKVKLQNKIKEDLRKINIIHLLFDYNDMNSIKRTDDNSSKLIIK